MMGGNNTPGSNEARNEARSSVIASDRSHVRHPPSLAAKSKLHSFDRKHERELLTHKLASASNAHLLQIAQFSKPKWQTITIVAMSVERWEMSFNTMAYWNEPDVATTDVEVLERSTLSDVRKLIAAFCSEIPKDFVFAELYRLMRSKDEEATMKIEDILEENRAVVLHEKRKDAKMQALSIVASRSSSTSALNTQSTTTRSLSTTMLNTQSSQSLKQLPAFSLAQQFGEVHAIADIYSKKTKGFTLKLHSFRVGHHAEAHVKDGHEEVVINLDAALLAERVDMTETIVKVLLSSSRGQVKLIQEILSQLELTVSDGDDDVSSKILWRWSAAGSAMAKEDIQLNKIKRAPVKIDRASQGKQGSEEKKVEALLESQLGSKGQATSKDLTSALNQEERAQSKSRLVEASRADSLVEVHIPHATENDPPRAHKTEPLANATLTRVEPMVLQPKESVETDASTTLRNCLEIVTKPLGQDMHPSSVVQIIFTELMLRNYSCSSLPEFVKEVRFSLREVLRPYLGSDPKSASAATAVLWVGLRISFWDAKIASYADHFRPQVNKSIETLQQKLLQARFPGFENASSYILPRRIETLVSCLGILADGSEKAGLTSTQELTVSLGLHDLSAPRKRLRVFRVANNSGKPKKGELAILKQCVRRLRALLDSLSPGNHHQSFSNGEETLYNTSLLKRVVIMLLNFVDFDLPSVVQQITDDGESPTQLQSLLRTNLKGLGTAPTSVDADQHFEKICAGFKSYFGHHEKKKSTPRHRQNLSNLLQKSDDPRWLKVDKDCAEMAACSRSNCRLRWYIHPCGLRADLGHERYLFVGEGDLLFEWVYIEFDVESNAEIIEDRLVERALDAWTPHASRMRESTTTSERQSRTAFGLNFRHAHQLEAMASIPKRGYDARICKQQTWSADIVLAKLLGGNSCSERLVQVDSVRWEVGVLSLTGHIAMGDSLAQQSVAVAMRMCIKDSEILLCQQVSHFVLRLILRQGVDVEFARLFLLGLIPLLDGESADKDDLRQEQVFPEFVNQTFIYALEEVPSASKYTPDVYDVLWAMSTCAALDGSVRELSRRTAVKAFLLSDIMTDFRILRYSESIRVEEFELDRASKTEALQTAAKTPSDDKSSHPWSYFAKIVSMYSNLKTSGSFSFLNSGDEVTTKALSKPEAFLYEMSISERNLCWTFLFTRYFTVYRSPPGFKMLPINQEVVNLLIEIVIDRRGCYSAELRGLVAECTHMISAAVQDNSAMRAVVARFSLIDLLLDAVWELDDFKVGTTIMSSLARFQMCPAFRLQLITSFSRISRQMRGDEESTIEEVIPTVRRNALSPAMLTQSRRFCMLILHQHTNVDLCECSDNKQLDGEARKTIAFKYARKYTSSIISTVLASRVGRGTWSFSSGKVPRRLQSAAVKFRKAVKIQRSFLRWLYISRHGNQMLPTVDKWWICQKCKKTPSFLAGIIVCLRETTGFLAAQKVDSKDDSSSKDPRPNGYLLCIETVLQCIRYLIRDKSICDWVSNDHRYLHLRFLVAIQNSLLITESFDEIVMKNLRLLLNTPGVSFPAITKALVMGILWYLAVELLASLIPAQQELKRHRDGVNEDLLLAISNCVGALATMGIKNSIIQVSVSTLDALDGVYAFLRTSAFSANSDLKKAPCDDWNGQQEESFCPISNAAIASPGRSALLWCKNRMLTLFLGAVDIEIICNHRVQPGQLNRDSFHSGEILGLLVLLMKPQASITDDQNEVFNGSASRLVNTVDVYSSVVNEFPLIMHVLQSYDRDAATGALRSVKRWSPLTLDAAVLSPSLPSDLGEKNPCEIVKAICWPVELIFMLQHSPVAPALTPETSHLEVLVQTLSDLDSTTIREWPHTIHGRQEATLQLASVLREFLRRIPFTKSTALQCLNILSSADAMMLYANELMVVVTPSLERDECLLAFLQSQSQSVVRIFQVLSKSGCRTDLYASCIDFLHKLGLLMKGEEYESQLLLFEAQNPASYSIIGERIHSMFSIQTREYEDWVLAVKAFDYFCFLMQMPSLRRRMITAIERKPLVYTVAANAIVQIVDGMHNDVTDIFGSFARHTIGCDESVRGWEDSQLIEEMRSAVAVGLAHVAVYHNVRHSKHMTKFVIKNYRYPVFLETNPVVKLHVIRVYRMCCCNAVVYRILRLGKSSLWDLTGEVDADDSFFRRLGRTFPSRKLSLEHQWEISLFLWHQFYSFSFANSPKKSFLVSSSKKTQRNPPKKAELLIEDDVLPSITELSETLSDDTSGQCLGDQFYSPYETSRVISPGAQEFEAGMISGLHPSDHEVSDAQDKLSAGTVLINGVVDLMITKMSSPGAGIQLSRRRNWIQECHQLLKIVNQLAQALKRHGAETEAKQCVISETSIEQIAVTIRSGSFDAVEELEIFYLLLRICCQTKEQVETLVRVFDLPSALVPRINVRTNALESCWHTIQFITFFIRRTDDKVKTTFAKNAEFVGGLFEFLALDCSVDFVAEVMDHSIRVLSALASFSTVERESNGSATIVPTARYMLATLDQRWQATIARTDASLEAARPSTHPSPQSFMLVLLQLLVNPHHVRQMTEPALMILQCFFDSEATLMTDKMLNRAALPALCNLMYDDDAGVRKQAIQLLQSIAQMAQSRSDNRVIAVLGNTFAGNYCPNYGGHVASILPAKQLNSANAINAQRTRAEKENILDMLQRLTIFSRVAANDLLLLSELTETVRFQPGDLILSDERASGIFIIVSGEVDWKLAVTRPRREKNAMRVLQCTMGKGCAFGSVVSRLFMTEDNSIREVAIARNDTVYFCIADRVWRHPATTTEERIGDHLRTAARRISGSLFHLGKHKAASLELKALATESYLIKLISIAQGDLGSDPAVLHGSKFLLTALCSEYKRRVKARSIPVELRRELVSLTLKLVRDSSAQYSAAVQTNWRSDGCCGLLVMARGFSPCALDQQCLLSWLQSVVSLVRSNEDLKQSFARAMTDGALLKLFGSCLIYSRDDLDVNPIVPYFLQVAGFVLQTPYGRQRLASCLTGSEQADFCRWLLLLLPAVSEADDTPNTSAVHIPHHSSVVQVLSSVSRHNSFKHTLWSLPEWESEIVQRLEEPTTLLEVKDNIPMRITITEFLCNMLEWKRAANLRKTQIIKWMNHSLDISKRILSLFSACLRDGQSETLVVASLSRRVLHILRVLSRFDGGTNAEIAQIFTHCSNNWSAALQTMFLRACEDECESANKEARCEVLRSLAVIFDAGVFEASPSGDLYSAFTRQLLVEHTKYWKEDTEPREACSSYSRIVSHVLSRIAKDDFQCEGSDQEKPHEPLALLWDVWAIFDTKQAKRYRKDLNTELLLHRAVLTAQSSESAVAQSILCQAWEKDHFATALNALMQIVCAPSGSFPASTVRLSGACVAQVFRGQQIVAQLAFEMKATPIKQLFLALQSRVALRAKLRALWYICRGFSKSESSLLSMEPDWLSILVNTVATCLDHDGKTLCYQGKIIHWLIDRFGGASSVKLVQNERVNSLIESLIHLIDVTQGGPDNPRYSQRSTGLCVVLAVARNYDQVVAAELVAKYDARADFRVAVCDFVALLLRSVVLGAKKCELQLFLTKDETGTMVPWLKTLKNGTVLEKARAARCIRLTCDGNSDAMHRFLAPGEVLVPVILESLRFCKDLLAKKIVADKEDCDHFKLPRFVCGTLRDLLEFDVLVLHTNSIDVVTLLSVVIPILHALVSSSEVNETASPDWANAIVSMLRLICTTVKHRAIGRSTHLRCSSLLDTHFLTISRLGIGGKAVSLALQALIRVIPPTQSHCCRIRRASLLEGGQPHDDEKRRCTLSERVDLLLSYADSQSDTVQLKGYRRVAALRVLHVLWRNTPHFQDDILLSRDMVRALADLAALSVVKRNSSKSSPASQGLVATCWDVITRKEKSKDGSQSAATEARHAHMLLRGFSVLVRLAVHDGETREFLQRHSSAFWSQFIDLYCFTRGRKALYHLRVLAGLVTMLFSVRAPTDLELSSIPLNLVPMFLADMTPEYATTSIPAILALCNSEWRHILSNSREKCLELLPASIEQMVMELQRNFLPAALCHLSFVSEVLAAAIEDNWRIAVLKCVDVKKRSLVFKVINLLLEIDTRVEPSAKIAEPNAWTQPPRIVFVKDEWRATSVVECFWMISRCTVDLVKYPTIATEIQDNTAFIRSICTTICDDYCAYLTHANLVLLSTILRDLTVCKRRTVTDAVDISAFVPLLTPEMWKRAAGHISAYGACFGTERRKRDSWTDFQSISLESIILRRVKEAAYASNLDDRGLEAAFGILAQLAKSAALHSAMLTMDESLPAALFFDDPDSLLSAIVPTAKESICTQQAKLVCQLCSVPASLQHVLAARNVLEALKTAVLTNVPPVCAPACQALGLITSQRDELRIDEYLQEVEGSDELICRDELQQIFEENDHELLQGIHQILATNIDTSGPASIHAQKAVCVSINVIYNVISSKALFVRLRTEVCNMASSEFVRLLLTFVTATMGNNGADEAPTKQHHRQRDELARINALRILRRVTKLASVAELFGIRAESHSELLDLVFILLHPLKIETAERCNQIHADDIVFHTLLAIENVSLDSSAADAITTRIDALVHYIVCPRPSLRVCKAFWDTAYNLVGHNLHLVKLNKCFSETLEEHLVNPNLERTTPSGIPELVDVITKTLRKVAERSIDSHANLVQLLPSYNHFLTTGAETHGFVLASSSLESIALTMSYIMGHIPHICKLHGEVPELEQEHHRGMQVAIERLVCSLCELLSSFHEDENKSTFPGYDVPWRDAGGDTPSQSTVGSTRKQTTSTTTPARKSHQAVQPIYASTRRRLVLHSKKTGVFCQGYSPPTLELHDQILGIFMAPCTFRIYQRASNVRGPIGCVDYHKWTVHALGAHRDVILAPIAPTNEYAWTAITVRHVAELRAFESEHHPFLASGAAKLLVRTVLKGITRAGPTSMTTRQQQAAPSTSDVVNVVDTFFLKYVQCIAVLSERSHFLQSTYYLVHAGEKESITIPSLIIAAIVHSKGCSSYILLASKILSRFLSVFSLQEAKRLFSTCITQIARTLGWQVTPLDVSLALVTMVGQTESEVITKTRVVVKVIHSTLLRTAILGLINKGIPEVLHDFGMVHMMAHMEQLLLHCKRYELASRIDQRSGSSSTGVNERAYRSASPPSAYKQTPVEKWMPTNLFTSGSYSEAGSTALAYGGAQLEECVASLKELTAEIAQYTMINFKLVFQSFESMNDDLELIEAMTSSEHAIMFTQSMFYALSLLQEALTTSLLDGEDGGNETGVSSRAASSSSSCASLDGEPLRADLVGETIETLQQVELFLAKFAQIMEWIIISLQHSDVDVLFYATQLQALLELTTHLFDIPTGLDEDQRGGAESEAETERPRPVGSLAYRSILKQKPGGRGRKNPLSFTPKAVANKPVYLRFHSLEIRSWFWSALGFLPYLRVKHQDDVRLIRFQPSTAQERVHSFSAVPFGGTSDAAFKCHFEADDPDADAMRTWFRDIPHTLDVEIWIYLPFWYQDVLISHLKLPLLTKFIDKKPFEFQYYPERSRGVRAYQPKALGTLVLDMCTSISSCYEQASSNTDYEFPAYSTLGSRRVRRVLRAIGSTLFGLLKRVYGATTQFIQEETLLTRGDRRRTTLVADTDLLSGDDAKTDTSTKKSVEALMKQILDVLLQSIHPDKLVGSYEKLNAAKECEILMVDLESTASEFTKVLTRGFETKTNRRGRSFSHSLPAKKRVFREVSSQLRYLGAPNVKDTAAEAPTQKANTGLAWHTNSLKLVPATKLLQTLKDNNVVTRVTKAALFAQASDDDLLAARASAHLHNAASKMEWRMLSPHVSLWNLAKERVPEWHSYSHMVVPTSLSHFLIQPMERLQVYCAVFQYLQPLCNNLNKKHAIAGAGMAPTLSSASLSKTVAEAKRGGELIRSVLRISSLQRNQRESESSSDRGVRGSTKLLRPKASTHSTEEAQLPGVLPALDDADRKAPSLSHETRRPSCLPSSTTAVTKPSSSGKLSKLTTLKRHLSTFLTMSENSTIALVQNSLLNTTTFTVDDCNEIEVMRARRLVKYHAMDPFDAAARLTRLYHDAHKLPSFLYREGRLGAAIHYALWFLPAATVWRISIARDAVRDSARSFQELYASQSSGDEWTETLRKSNLTPGNSGSNSHDEKPFIVISDRHNVSHQSHLTQRAVHSRHVTQRKLQHKVHDESTETKKNSSPKRPKNSIPKDFIKISEKELQHFVIVLEVESLLSDMMRVWPMENGNIGLGGFWSSLLFTFLAVGSPVFFLYGLFPWLMQRSDGNVKILSNITCAYGAFWIMMAFFSILSITRSIPAFRDECFQLNTTSFSVWEMSYKPKRIAALTTIDLQNLGLGFVQVNIFETMQTLTLLCLLLWYFCLKASNKFKSIQWLNYFLTFLLPNFLGGLMFMFLSKQFYLSTACVLNAKGETVLSSNDAILCWRDVHLTYALHGMFGMSVFVPIAVLAFGSYQVFFPELKLDVQTSPLLNVSSQIVKAAMMGALTFFVERVTLALGFAVRWKRKKIQQQNLSKGVGTRSHSLVRQNTMATGKRRTTEHHQQQFTGVLPTSSQSQPVLSAESLQASPQ
ncbi:hypothetical protein FI667_g15840, partial [Globisporangium splendens]